MRLYLYPIQLRSGNTACGSLREFFARAPCDGRATLRVTRKKGIRKVQRLLKQILSVLQYYLTEVEEEIPPTPIIVELELYLYCLVASPRSDGA